MPDLVTPTTSARSSSRRAGHDASRGLGVAVFIAAGLLVLFLALPLGAMSWRAIQESRGLTPEGRDLLWQALTLSLTTSLASLAIITLLGTPLAWLLVRRRFRGARLVDTLVDLPIVLPPAVAGIALLMAFGRQGVFGQWLDQLGITVGFTTTAVVMAQVFVAAPFYVRSAKTGLLSVSPETEEAAMVDGATGWMVFRDITLPLALPGIAAGLVLAWARALGEFGATIMFAGNFPGITQTMPLAIYGRFSAGDLQSALVLSLVLLVTSLAILLTARTVSSRSEDTDG
ncbi:MAG: molybdate ABC transporter permease subunit [Chloroflexia bacterium]|jgi:molybdate transport system permease protein|nr:molybdate ABC transporter permease subunit [Chloroflexia bacterium]MDQ3613478.1 ABC transporter permease [Chloroflexota bacterium]